MRAMLRAGSGLVVLAILSWLGTSVFSSPSAPAPAAVARAPVEDFTEHEPLDLVFDSVGLRGKIITVRARMVCLNDAECTLDIPSQFDAIIDVRLLGVPLGLRRQLFHRFRADDCPQLLTGYFSGYDLLVIQFRPTPECRAISDQPNPDPPPPVTAAPSASGVPLFQSAGMEAAGSFRITESDLDAYTDETATRFRH